MANVRGLTLANIRTLFQKRALADEQLFLSKLTETEKDLYATTLTSSWNPLELQTNIYKHAAEVLFPEESEKYVALGKATSEISYTNVYKLFFRVLSPQVVIRQFANIWYLHHDTGKPSYKSDNSQHIQVWVKNFPGLPAITRQVIKGHMIKILEMVGVKEFTIRIIEDDPEAWCWEVVWVK